ncbi:MAG: AAA family ATPase, partial [Vicinamibacterales bacterium]
MVDSRTDWLADDDDFNATLGDLDRGLDEPSLNAAADAPAVLPAAPVVSAASPAPASAARTADSDADTLPPLAAMTFRRRDESDAHLPRRLLNVFPESALEPAQASGNSTYEAEEPWLPPSPTVTAPPASSRAQDPAPRFFSAGEEPSSTPPDPKAPYRSAPYERAEQALLAAIRARSGPAVLTAPLGMGKTTLCRGLLQEVDRRTISFLAPEPPQSFDELLTRMLVAFGVMATQDPAGAPIGRAVLMRTLNAFLESLAPLHATALVVIDDAQEVPVDVLVELHALLTAVGPAPDVLQLVLVGEPALTALLTHADLRDLNARIADRTELGPLGAADVSGYVARRLSLVGGRSRRHFNEAAAIRLFERTSGVPRLVNLISDRAITLAREMATPVIDASLIAAAAADIDRAAWGARPRL